MTQPSLLSVLELLLCTFHLSCRLRYRCQVFWPSHRHSAVRYTNSCTWEERVLSQAAQLHTKSWIRLNDTRPSCLSTKSYLVGCYDRPTTPTALLLQSCGCLHFASSLYFLGPCSCCLATSFASAAFTGCLPAVWSTYVVTANVVVPCRLRFVADSALPSASCS